MVERICESSSQCNILQRSCQQNTNPQINSSHNNYRPTKTYKPDISPAVRDKKIIGTLGMPITIPTQKQADKIYEKRTEQYHKIKDTYGSTLTPDPHQMSLIPKKSHLTHCYLKK